MPGNKYSSATFAGKEWFKSFPNLDRSGLLAVRRKGMRNGNWRRLSPVDRGLFRCALWVVKVRGGLVNLKLMARVLCIVLKLLEDRSMRIWKAGEMRAEELKLEFEGRGLFDWAPRVAGWLVERNFILYLGLGVL